MQELQALPHFEAIAKASTAAFAPAWAGRGISSNNEIANSHSVALATAEMAELMPAGLRERWTLWRSSSAVCQAPSSQAAMPERCTASLLRMRRSASQSKAMAHSHACPKAHALTAAPRRAASGLRLGIAGPSRESPCCHRDALPHAHSADVTAALRAVARSGNRPSCSNSASATDHRIASAQALMPVPMLTASGVGQFGASKLSKLRPSCHFFPRARAPIGC